MILISVFVAVMSAPIYAILGLLTNTVLLAPTVEEVKRDEEDVRERRMSAVQLVNQQLAVNAAGSVGKNSNPIQTADTIVPRVRAFSLCSTINDDLHENQRAVLKAARSSRLQLGVGGTGGLGSGGLGLPGTAAGLDKFDNPDELLRDLSEHACTLSGRERDRFLSQWPVLRPHAEAKCVREEALRTELAAVVEESNKWKKKMKKAPTSHKGVYLLELFVKDLIGRTSRKSKIFLNQVQTKHVEDKFVVTWGAKCLAITALILLNIFFIFTCMLYGRRQGNVSCSMVLCLGANSVFC